MTTKSSSYFSGLDELRFFAAAAVLLHHFEQLKYEFGYPNMWEAGAAISYIGKEGVRLFFVISGFLITFLLIKELSETNKISILRFYIRRILRIWPLYFLIVGLAFFVCPVLFDFPKSAQSTFSTTTVFHDYWDKLRLFVLFLPNMCNLKYPPVIGAAHCWSLGVEEQFYLIWPVWLYAFRKNVILGIFSAIGLRVFLMGGISYGVNHWGFIRNNDSNVEFANLVANTIGSIDAFSFACGGFAACALFAKNARILSSCQSRMTWLFVIPAVILGCSLDFPNRTELMSVAFAVLVLRTSMRQSNRNYMGSEIFAKLGRISFGIYMLHPIIMILILQNLSFISWGPLENVCVFLAIFGTIIAASYLSYRFFESPFLLLKDKLADPKNHA